MSFINNHPRGKSAILPFKGKDMTQAFDDIGHSGSAQSLLQRYSVKRTREQIINEKNKVMLSKKLFTPEDKFLIHKIFGLIALISFTFKYFYVFPTTGTLDIEPSNLNYFLLIGHVLLSCSSLIFHVIEKRILKNPLIIYQEYRLHAILFTFRSIFIALIGMYQLAYGWQLVSVCGIHILADLVTMRYGTKGVTAVRVNDENYLKHLKLFFSFYQFLALGSHLLPSDKIADLGYNTLIAVQSSAFLMTLKRKGLINWPTYAIFYGLALVLSITYMWWVKGTLFIFVVGIPFALRVKFNANKYVLWSLFVLGYSYVL